MIPSHAESLEKFFYSLAFVPPSSASTPSIELLPAAFSSNGEQMGASMPVLATYDPGSGDTPDAAINRVAKELAAVGHLADVPVVRTVLALYALTERLPGTAIARLNALIDSIANAEAMEHLIAPFPAIPGLRSFVADDFTFGLLDYDRLVYWCERVSCDYFYRYPGSHRGRFAIQRAPHPVRLLDIPAYGAKVPRQLASKLVDQYFQAISDALLNRFRSDALAAQEVLIAAGAPFVDPQEPRMWHGGAFIVVYRNIGTQRVGYFCPLAHGLRVDFAKIDERTPAVQEQLKAVYGFSRPASHEIGETLRTFCRFVARAKVHEVQSRVSEAFLHQVIALDLLFGDRDAATQAVARRAAVCAYADFGSSFHEMLKITKALYDVRSRYVHAGIQVSPGDLDSIQVVCNSVFRSLLRLHRQVPETAEQKTIVWWQRQLDFIASSLEADRVPTAEDLARLGLASAPPVTDS
jgi:hypothetical protein